MNQHFKIMVTGQLFHVEKYVKLSENQQVKMDVQTNYFFRILVMLRF